MRRPLLALAALLLALPLGMLGVELYARRAHLDLRAARATAIQRQTGQWMAARAAPDGWGVPYLPRVFSLGPEGIETAWGTCRFDHAGPSLLLLGDSTTRQASSPQRSRALPFPPADQPDAIARHEAARTWPARLAAALPPGTQRCVLAEDGYHPADLLELARRMRDRLELRGLVVLLCANDIEDIAARVAIPRDDGLLLVELPPWRLVHRDLFQPWLFERSEAFRFLHHQLAQGSSRGYELPVDDRQLGWEASIRGLLDLGARLFYLPPLDEEAAARDPAWDRLRAVDPQAVRLELPPPMDRWRRAQADPVHLSDEGHEEVARQVARALGLALP